jgi:hypothetical protein
MKLRRWETGGNVHGGKARHSVVQASADLIFVVGGEERCPAARGRRAKKCVTGVELDAVRVDRERISASDDI